VSLTSWWPREGSPDASTRSQVFDSATWGESYAARLGP
jgi:hypothetical protein